MVLRRQKQPVHLAALPQQHGSWEFFDWLLETANVVGTPGEGFGECGKGYFRLTAFGDAAKTKEAAARIVAARKPCNNYPAATQPEPDNTRMIGGATMTPSEEIMQFLKDNPTFYLATVDGYLPRVRPLGFAMWYKDHLCLGIGKHKAAYKQLLDNTNLEICACNEKGEFLRVQGTANFDNTPEAQAAAFKIMPQLADMYNEETGLKLGIIYLDHLSAKLFSMSGSVKDIMAY